MARGQMPSMKDGGTGIAVVDWPTWRCLQAAVAKFMLLGAYAAGTDLATLVIGDARRAGLRQWARLIRADLLWQSGAKRVAKREWRTLWEGSSTHPRVRYLAASAFGHWEADSGHKSSAVAWLLRAMSAAHRRSPGGGAAAADVWRYLSNCGGVPATAEIHRLCDKVIKQAAREKGLQVDGLGSDLLAAADRVRLATV